MELTETTKRKLAVVAREEVFEVVRKRLDIQTMTDDLQRLEEELVKYKEAFEEAKDAEWTHFGMFVDMVRLSNIDVDANSPEAVFVREFAFHETGEEKIIFARICADVRRSLEGLDDATG